MHADNTNCDNSKVNNMVSYKSITDQRCDNFYTSKTKYQVEL